MEYEIKCKKCDLPKDSAIHRPANECEVCVSPLEHHDFEISIILILTKEEFDYISYSGPNESEFWNKIAEITREI